MKPMKRLASAMVIAHLLFMGSASLLANGYVTLQSGNTHSFYSTIVQAYEAAQDGDVIIIPGGTYTMPPNIEKALSFIGAGYDPRYSSATGITTISNEFFVKHNNVSMEGLYMPVRFFLEAPDANGVRVLRNIVISRCRFLEIRKGYDLDQVVIKECVFGRITTFSGYHFGNMVVSNSFIERPLGNLHGVASYATNIVFQNNVFLTEDHFSFMHSCTFRNNIFVLWNGQIALLASNNIMLNNIFVPDANFNTSVVVNENNQGGVSLDALFTSFQAEDQWKYDFSVVYELRDGSPALGAGTDGTACGVWGGQYPWKRNAVSILPHIQEMVIAPVTNLGGKLQIECKVEAQNQ